MLLRKLMQTQTDSAEQWARYFKTKIAKLLLLRHCQRFWELLVHRLTEVVTLSNYLRQVRQNLY